MNFYEKYKKYKNKYIILKNQNGGVLLDCDKNMYLHNILGTCWNASIQMIFLFSDETADIVQSKLVRSIDENICNILDNNELILCLPVDFFEDGNLKSDINDRLLNIFNEFKKRFMIKLEDKSRVGPLLKRQASEKCEYDFSLSVLSLLHKDFVVPSQDDATNKLGGNYIEQFFMVLLFGIFLCEKLIDFNIFLLYNTYNIDFTDPLNTYYFKNRFSIDDIKDTFGIIMNYNNHACCFYKCCDTYIYYDSSNYSNSQNNFNLIDFIKIINQHNNSKKEYYIFQFWGEIQNERLNFLDRLPFIVSITDNCIYYQNDKLEIKNIKISMSIQSFLNLLNNSDDYLKFKNFITLKYSDLSPSDYNIKYKYMYIYYYINKGINFDEIKTYYETIDDYLKISLFNEFTKPEKNETLIKSLIENITNTDIINKKGETLLLLTIMNDQYELAKLILAKSNNKDYINEIIDDYSDIIKDEELKELLHKKLEEL